MSTQRTGDTPNPGESGAARTAAEGVEPGAPTDRLVEPEPADLPEVTLADDAVLYEEQVKPEYGVLGFTLRELLIVGAWALAFIVSFFPVVPGASSTWGHGISWVLSIGIPTAAVFLIVLRRFSPDGIRRVGSLGIDQFASVAFSVAAVVWAEAVWTGIARTIEFGVYVAGWVPFVEAILMLALVAFTVAAPLIPGLREDFQGRLETLAHRNANPVRPVIPRPRQERPAPSAAPEISDSDAAEQGDITPSAPAGAPDERGQDDVTQVLPPIEESGSAAPPADPTLEQPVEWAVEQPAEPAAVQPAAPPYEEPPHEEPQYEEPQRREPGVETAVNMLFAGASDDTHDASADRYDVPAPVTGQPTPFWILAPTERDVFDEHGQPLFRIGPTAWALAIEDRGGAYVVRHDDGRIGYLHDISDITKG